MDASRKVATRWDNRVPVDLLEHVDPRRRDTAGKVDPTKFDRRRAAKTQRHVDPTRVDAFRPEKPRRLNDEGKRNRSMALPVHRMPCGLVEAHHSFLVERGTLWQTKEELFLSWADDATIPTLWWSQAQRPGKPVITVPKGSFITYAGTRRVDARVHDPSRDEAKPVVARCLQAVFLYGQYRCVVWDFNQVEPIPDDDDEDDAQPSEDL